MSALKMYTHGLSDQDPEGIVPNALRILRPRLPISIPLYRRLQFGRFFQGATLLTSLPAIGQDPAEQDVWVMAFVDRTCRPETEVWIYGSWEDEKTILSGPQQDSLIVALIKAIRNLGPLPTSIHQDLLDNVKQRHEEDQKSNSKDVSGVARSDYTAHLLNTNLILCGAIHSSTTKNLERNGFIKHVFDAGLVPNHTYIFDTTQLPPIKELPPGLRWGELQYEHFALVRSRTQIPRQDRTLATLPNLAIFNNTLQPVAWVFVGIDASLTTLHVEEEYRGKGLAKMIAIKLWKERMDRFWEDGMPKWAHDYVIQGNEASVATSKSLGGRYIGDTFWIRVDMARVDENNEETQ